LGPATSAVEGSAVEGAAGDFAAPSPPKRGRGGGGE